ncbi:hypothetical protein [Streptomyces rochei]|uniref:hypothetical protein n=1 Tax=Streptomyces rochei TaxID=1928 RepID=UPI0033BC19D6
MADATGRARRQELLEAMRRSLDIWTTSRTLRFYKANGWDVTHTVARLDLRVLQKAGHLVQLGPNNQRGFRIRPGAAQPHSGWQTPFPSRSCRKHRPR